MTAPNYHGYTESDDRVQMRAERRKAERITFEVFQASQLTDDEKIALLECVAAIELDPAHIAVAPQYLNTRRVMRRMDPPTAAAQTEAAYGTGRDPRSDAQIAADADYNDLLRTQEDARH